MKNYVNLLFKKVILASFVCAFGLSSIAQEVEEVVVTAEKRSESLQDISQAVTALTATDIAVSYTHLTLPTKVRV